MPRRFKIICACEDRKNFPLSDSEVFGALSVRDRFGWSRCLRSWIGSTQALFLVMSKWLRTLGELPGARRWGETFWHVVHTVITNGGSGLLLSLGCCSLLPTHCTASGHCLTACLPIVVLIIHSLLAQDNYFLHSARSSSRLSLLVHSQCRSEKKQVSSTLGWHAAMGTHRGQVWLCKCLSQSVLPRLSQHRQAARKHGDCFWKPCSLLIMNIINNKGMMIPSLAGQRMGTASTGAPSTQDCPVDSALATPPALHLQCPGEATTSPHHTSPSLWWTDWRLWLCVFGQILS